MRVALIATHHAEYAANLAWALANDDDVLLVLSARNAARQLHPDTLARLRTRLPVTIVPHHYAPLQPLVAALCLRAVAAFRPDVVHIQEHPSRAPAWVAQALRGRYPLVTTVHDPLPHTGADTRAAASFVRSFARLRSSSDALIVHGAALVAQLAATEPDGTERVRVAPHGVLRCGRLADGPTPSSAPGRDC